MRKSLVAASLLFAVAAAPVLAQESPHTFTGNVSLASEYTYRGIGQTNRKPALQGGFDYSHSSGFYLGTWASNISWLSDASRTADYDGDGTNDAISSSLEWDFYGGYKFAAGPVGLDFGVLQYYYPGSFPDGFTDPDTTELYGAATWKWLTFKYSYAVTNLFGAKNGTEDTKGSQYVELNGAFDVGGGFTLGTHVGRQIVANFGDASYTDWKLGVTKEWVGVTFGLAYVGTNAKGDAGQFYRNAYNKDLGKDTFVLSVSKTF